MKRLDSDIVGSILLQVVLIAVNAVFACAEIAVVSCNDAKLEKMAVDLLKSLLAFQSEDGRWYQVVNRGDDPANWLENSCSCLYVAALCKAIRKGLLDASYLEYARKGYEGVIRSLTWEGDDLIIGNVCIGTGVGDYDHYIHRPVSANDLHGVGAFLLMCEECEQVF